MLSTETSRLDDKADRLDDQARLDAQMSASRPSRRSKIKRIPTVWTIVWTRRLDAPLTVKFSPHTPL